MEFMDRTEGYGKFMEWTSVICNVIVRLVPIQGNSYIPRVTQTLDGTIGVKAAIEVLE